MFVIARSSRIVTQRKHSQVSNILFQHTIWLILTITDHDRLSRWTMRRAPLITLPQVRRFQRLGEFARNE